ncbi:MAG TPA: aminotransferase class V-fold PLP-dependent enzyme [Panacibacter sp.]|nr:aminotransferase class V-fold PLP-dependent enzyme [Panacibacter sp.]
MLTQKHLFQLPEDIHYLNCAYMSPLLKSVEEAGINGMQKKRNPANIKADDFFSEAATVREQFGALINCNAVQVAVIPSASYGLKTAVNNLPTGKGKFAITIGDEFPSGYYSIEGWCIENNKELIVIKAPETKDNRAEKWNEQLLESITADTVAVVMSSIHWMDGTIFNLEAIGKRCKETATVFIVDGTQSVGALPMDVSRFCIDALICAAYKWLLGPYSTGLAYFSEFFNNGKPLEETWKNRTNALDFPRLTNYTTEYKSGAGRYNMGESANFTLMPMLNTALTQIAEWNVENIQDYCSKLIAPLEQFLYANNFHIEDAGYRANHLFGFQLPPFINTQQLMGALQEKKINVSLRGNAVRISPHLYNTENDINVLMGTLSGLLQ